MNRSSWWLVGLAMAGIARSQDDSAAAAPPPLNWKSVLPDFLGKGLLKGLDLDFKTFDNPAGGSSFGFAYDYDRAFRPYGDAQGSLDWLVIHPRFRGNVAFDSDANPEDFLTARIDVGGKFSGGGTTGSAFLPADTKRYHQLQRDAADIDSESELEEFLTTSPDALWFASMLSPQLGVELALSAGIEADQTFTSRQGTFGATVAVDLDLWGSAAGFNLFDYPFALLRHLANEELNPGITALGSTFPQLLVGLDYVTPIEGDPRLAAGENDEYWRARAEVAMRSPIAHVGEQTLFFNCSYRVFYELGAASTIRSADLDLYQYGSVSVTASNGMFARYVSGSLPLDQRGNAFEVGWSYEF